MDLLKHHIFYTSNLVKNGKNSYKSTSNDPQIWFSFNKPKGYGWYKLIIKAHFITYKHKNIASKLFVDFGSGFSEEFSHDFDLNNGSTTILYLKLNQNFKTIRFDPHENAAGDIAMNISVFDLVRLNKYKVFLDHIIKDRRNIGNFFINKAKNAGKAFSNFKKEIKSNTIEFVEFPRKTEKKDPSGTKVFLDMTHFLKHRSPDYKEKREFPVFNSSIKPIAFYLPQFHTIKENDINWGKGFTEWTNTTKAFSQFEGHYQPHLPSEFGYTDLTDKNAIKKQVEVAKFYGINAFCIYHYWFQGRRVLERPLDIFYENKDLDLNFMICWANENWTKRWDGLDGEILLRQDHNEKTDKEYIDSVIHLFKDSRYLKINNKPILMVYKPALFPDFKETAKQWRETAKKNGFDDLFLVSVLGFGCEEPAKFGLDALVEFPPATPAGFIELDSSDQKKLKIYNPDFAGKIYDYRKVAENLRTTEYPGKKVFRGIMPSWDNTPRRNNDGHIFHFSSPSAYKRWFYGICESTYKNLPENEQFVFINAWNEWAEGTHLEPDRYYGYSVLDATAQVLEYFPKKIPVISDQKKELGFCIHIYHHDLWDEISTYLTRLKPGFQLFISITDHRDKKAEVLKKDILNVFPDANIKIIENKGRDILPFLNFTDEIIKSGCKYLCKIHTKRSLHREDGELWRKELYDKLIANDELVTLIHSYFKSYSKLGILGPEGHLINSKNYWGPNKRLFNILTKKLNYTLKEEFHFIAGTMFWIRTDLLKTLKSLKLTEQDFESEAALIGIKDGTMSHAVERIFSICAEINEAIVADTRIFHGELSEDFNEIERFDPSNYGYAIPIPDSFQ